MKSFSITDTGKTRLVNQDYVFATEEKIGKLENLFIVADGMGGHNAGDYASRFCVEVFTKIIKEPGTEGLPVSILSHALAVTNQELLEEARSRAELNGMGTTFVISTILNDILYVANIGDSRLYLVRNGEIKQVTEDHSLVEEMVKNGEIEREQMRFHPNKNIITRALGASETVVPDYFEVELRKDDLILMCSDGLSNMMDDKDMLEITDKFQDDLENACRKLAARANDNGGKDNISIVMIRM
ncbi:protein phosphatase [Anaerocolumna jejuensis DSM 15929]|uniref:Protein phosphatase n=1 Tax=Anaerocolumna jejuensis DSM 15929 TaxID=1121322 RepID=A0A1M6NJ63_9FIRM|nr:Stp1/IreP family PP2C-type Ser/Thr phosphatase [Anaerocolumna jejuensis]SHJ95781.1 protein phosphatase [Anaerocolumna jejuensis DSM 15929]